MLFFGLKCYKVFIVEDTNSRTEIFNNNRHFFSEKFCSLLLFVYLCRVFTKSPNATGLVADDLS